ncbi:hypothetical protein [Marinifilum fragile]|uniref:hypothetical protein n=1 Tax=Marinifilum fragile TaxID=570161 RepID=UPI002AA5ED96|nr:hypothetical protein [Marinifilum fragile]
MKNNLMFLALIIPVLVLLAHDIIPHHHHGDHGHVHDNQDYHQNSHSHKSGTNCHHKDSDTHHLEFTSEKKDVDDLFFVHKHGQNEKNTCFLTHHRVQKEIKYQVFLKSDHIDYGYRENIEKSKYYIVDFRLPYEPLRLIPHRRGPPNLFLA